MRVLDWWAGLSARRRGLVVFLAAVVAAGAVAVSLQAMRRASDANTATGAPAQDRAGPVLLVPGYGGSRDSLSTLADRIRRSGRVAEVLTLPGDGTGDLRAQTRVLDRAAADAVAAGAPSVDVIGYSAGGVVARLWVTGDGAAVARRVITLGAPLHGSRVATAGGAVAPGACPVACQQLSPGSALLTELDGQPVTLPWLSVWTENDRTVIPPDSARLADAVNMPTAARQMNSYAAVTDGSKTSWARRTQVPERYRYPTNRQHPTLPSHGKSPTASPQRRTSVPMDMSTWRWLWLRCYFRAVEQRRRVLRRDRR
ncbi:MAG: lipase [Actinophytocola sp.]|uniref:esterase/lipase family protein n=1 Tax=Actinophytocola sp. TaxID=1872138 RepID=UPI001325C2AA|nr:lipase [Actinophytocola sp.]MPZ81052.1 lipase [Actinophytocola sp.]